MSLRGRFVVVLAMVAACSGDSGPSNQTHFQLLSSVAGEPLGYAGTLVETCCPKELWPSSRAPLEPRPACRELQRVIEKGLNPVGAFSNWGPNCYVEIPTTSLVNAFQRGVEKQELVELLGQIDPSADVVKGLFAELRKYWLTPPSFATAGEAAHVDAVSWSLALAGEDELAIVATALRSEDPIERYWAAHVFTYVTQAPMDLPEASRGLSLLVDRSSDTDPLVARALAQSQSWARLSTDEAVARISRESSSRIDHASRSGRERERMRSRVIALLSRRRALCDSHLATLLLDTFKDDSDSRSVYLAERAIDLRARMCGSKLAN